MLLDYSVQANVALVRLRSRVDFQMPFQVCGRDETLGANVTFVGTFARVRPQMLREGAQPGELFLANVAPMRFLSRVHHAVAVQG